nr:reverse transcriptase domain-containing protein [Tanacetum cinerariifolium]
MSAKEHEGRHKSRRSCSPRPSPSVFSKIRCDRSRSPRSREKEGGVFKRLGSRRKSVSARSDSHDQRSYSRYPEALLESEDSGGGHWKSRSKKKKSNEAEDDLSQPWKKCIKDPIEIHNIKQQDRESMEDFVKRYKLESRDVKEAPECMRIFGFVHGITNPKLIKRLHDKIPKTVDKMMRVTTSFLKGEVAASNHERKKSFHHGNNKRNNEKEQPKAAKKEETSRKDKALVILMNQLVPANTPLIGFNGEIIWPIGQIQLLVKIGDEERSISAWMNFVVVRKPFGYKANNERKNQSGNKSIISGANNNDQFHSHKDGRNKLCDLLQRNPDIFAWKHADMTGVPRHIAEHRLNKSDFHWTTETEEAFKQMKRLIAELSLLAMPMEKEELIVYLEAAKEMVSIVLMTKRETKQMPIYFVSRALKGPEINYTSMKKLVLYLVHADFIVKRPEEDSPDTLMEVEEELPEPWILFTDRSYCTDEYEALIVGLRIAEQMGVKNLQANVNSRLVANQVNGTYVTKEADMIRYLEKVHKPVPRNLQQNLTPIASLWPFYKWGIDIAGPFPKGPGKVKFLIVAIDYFTKWIESKPIATITGTQIKKFVWDNIVCRFGFPEEIISDNGK